MSSSVVLVAVIAVAAAAPQFFVQPPHSPAVVLDPLGRPLDTAEVASARALHYQAKALEGHVLKRRSLEHAVAYTVPGAVSHQSRVDVRSSPVLAAAPVVADAILAEPLVQARAVVAPSVAVHTGAVATSHQSRVDVRTSSPVVAVNPVVAEPAVEAYSVYAAPVPTLYAGGSAVSHQSRFDVRSSPAILSQQAVAPAVVDARSVLAPTIYAW